MEPIKRRGEMSGTFFEAQPEITTRDVKRLRRDFADSFDIAHASDPFSISQVTYSESTQGFSIPESPFTGSWGSSFGGASYETFDTVSEPRNSFLNPLVSSFSIGSFDFGMRDPNFVQEPSVTEPDLQISINQFLAAPDPALWNHGSNTELLSDVFESVDQYSMNPPLLNDSFENANRSEIESHVQSFIPIEDNLLAYFPDTDQGLQLNGNTISLEGVLFEEAVSYGGVYFDNETSLTRRNQVSLTLPRNFTTPHVSREDDTRNPYREILPSPQTGGQLAEVENHLQLFGSSVYGSNISSLSQQHDGTPLEKATRRKLGRPPGSKLDIYTKKRAAEMRIIGSCFRCKTTKVACSQGDICDACKTSLPRPTLTCRSLLHDYTFLFFPDVVICGFQDLVVENLIHENVPTGFFGKRVAVDISSGQTYQPISLWVQEFQPADDEFLALPHIKTDEDGNLSSEFTSRYTPPFALPPTRTKILRRKCLEHVEMIARNPRNEGEVYYKDTSRVSWEILGAIYKYQRSTNNELVGQAMVLYAMHYFMTQTLVFTGDSADLAMKSLRFPTKLSYTSTLTSKLLSLQIKRVMYRLVEDATGRTLTELESTMLAKNGNEGTAWTTSFCVISILNMCAEMVQIASDLKIVHMISEEEGYAETSREDIVNHKRGEALFDCQSRFHLVFKTHKRNGNQRNERGFNPLKHGLEVYREKGLSHATKILINDVREVLAEHEHDIGQRVIEPSIEYNPDDLSDLLARHLTFREETSGKFVSRFLRSFLDNN